MAKSDNLFFSIKQGDEQAFRTVFNQYYRYLTTIAWRMLGEEQAAQDIVQEAFMELWNRRSKLPDDLLLKSYLRQITVNKSINFLKKQKRITLGDNEYGPLQAAFVKEHDQIDFDSMTAIINHTVDHLPDKCRIIFSMSRFENMKHKEIAAQLNISTKTIENQITIALKRIRSALKRKGFLSLIFYVLFGF